MSLTVHLLPDVSNPSKPQKRALRLPRFGKNVKSEALTVHDSCLLESRRRFHLVSGSLVSSNFGAPPIRVICKISFDPVGRDRLLRESLIYDHLKDLQGKVVPCYFGYFENVKVAGCLVLEYAGEALTTCFDYLDDELK